MREHLHAKKVSIGVERPGEEFLLLVAERELAPGNAGDDVKDPGLRTGDGKWTRSRHKRLKIKS